MQSALLVLQERCIVAEASMNDARGTLSAEEQAQSESHIDSMPANKRLLPQSIAVAKDESAFHASALVHMTENVNVL